MEVNEVRLVLLYRYVSLGDEIDCKWSGWTTNSVLFYAGVAAWPSSFPNCL